MSVDTSRRERVVSWTDPRILAGAARTMEGLATLEAIRDKKLPPPPIAELMRLDIVEVAEGRVVFSGLPSEEHYNPGGIVHGGFVMTLLDTALGCSITSALPAGTMMATTDLHARMLRAITVETGLVRCEATLTSLSRTLATADARVVDAAGTLLATGTTACAIRRPAT